MIVKYVRIILTRVRREPRIRSAAMDRACWTGFAEHAFAQPKRRVERRSGGHSERFAMKVSNKGWVRRSISVLFLLVTCGFLFQPVSCNVTIQFDAVDLLFGQADSLESPS